MIHTNKTTVTYQINVKPVSAGDVRCYVYRQLDGKSLLTAYTRGRTGSEAVSQARSEVRMVRHMGGMVRR